MVSLFWEAFGIAAGIIVLTSFVAQIIKGYRTKKLDDLSYFFSLFFMIGMGMWVTYGVVIGSFSVVITNIVGVLFSITLLMMKWHYSEKK